MGMLFARRVIPISALLTVPQAWALDLDARATPYRPTISSPASLSQPGWLEVEMGFARFDGGDDKRRENFNYLLKYAFTEDWGISLGGEAWVGRRAENDTFYRGGGDTSVTLKRRFAVSEATQFGLEAGVTVPTAAAGIGSGGTDYTVNGILSRDWGIAHLDVNLRTTRLGRVDAGAGRYETAGAAALSFAGDGTWGAAVELSGAYQRHVAVQAQWLAALSYAADKRVMFDFGLAWGASQAAPRFGVFAGVTYLWEKLAK